MQAEPEMEIGMEKRKTGLERRNMWILLLLTGAVYFFLKYLVPLLSPMITAVLFVTIFGPFLHKLQQRFHIPRPLGAFFLLVLFLVGAGAIGWLLSSGLMGTLPKLLPKIREMSKIDPQILWEQIESKVLPGALVSSLPSLKCVVAVGGFLVAFVISVLFFAKDYDRIMNELLDREESYRLLEIVREVIHYIATYVKAQGILLTVNCLVCVSVLWAIGSKDGIYWGMLAGILDALPFVGTGIVLVPMAVVHIFAKEYAKAGVVGMLYAGCIFIRQALEPRLIGKEMGIPPFGVLISIYAGVGMFGVAGIIKGPLGLVILLKVYRSLRGGFLDRS